MPQDNNNVAELYDANNNIPVNRYYEVFREFVDLVLENRRMQEVSRNLNNAINRLYRGVDNALRTTIPPRPLLVVSCENGAIVLNWNLRNYNENIHSEIAYYQIYAYCGSEECLSEECHHYIGDVEPAELPMSYQLQMNGNPKMYFIVRAVDVYDRCGNFSYPKTW